MTARSSTIARDEAAVLRQLAEAQAVAHLGSWVWDVPANELQWSDELYLIYGLVADGLAPTYEDYLDRMHPDDRDRTNAIVQQAYRDGLPFEYEHRIVRTDGAVRTLQARGEVELGPDGTAIRMHGTGQDITERVQAEQERFAMVREREQRIAAEQQAARMIELLELAPAGIAVFRGPNHVCELANATHRGFAPGREQVGLAIRDAFPEIEGQGYFELLDGVYASGKAVTVVEARVMLARGPGGAAEEAYFDIVYQALHDGPETISGVIVQAVEVTDRVASQRARDAVRNALSHDLKQPLTTIRGSAALLQRRAARGDGNVAEVLRRAESIDRAAKRMGAMIEDLLDAARVQTGETIVIDQTPTDLVALISDVVAEWQQTDESDRFSLDSPTRELIGNFDVIRIQRVFGNLLSNAVNHSRPSSRIVVRVETEESGGRPWALVRVEDTGNGIPVADLGRIFDPYFRASNASTPGAGIGLTGARAAVEQHGGTLTAESIEGRGSTFTVRLPLRVAS